MAAAASAAGPDGMVSVRAFRQHYRNARERMVRQQEGGSSSRAAPAGGGLELAVAAPVPAAAAAARLAISDLRSLSDHDEVDRRIEERIVGFGSPRDGYGSDDGSALGFAGSDDGFGSVGGGSATSVASAAASSVMITYQDGTYESPQHSQ